MAGTATARKPWQSSISELNEALTPHYRKGGGGGGATVEETRDQFRIHQIPAKVAMLDTEAGGVALIAQTENGYLIRIPFTEAECLDMARALLAKVRAR